MLVGLGGAHGSVRAAGRLEPSASVPPSVASDRRQGRRKRANPPPLT